MKACVFGPVSSSKTIHRCKGGGLSMRLRPGVQLKGHTRVGGVMKACVFGPVSSSQATHGQEGDESMRLRPGI